MQSNRYNWGFCEWLFHRKLWRFWLLQSQLWRGKLEKTYWSTNYEPHGIDDYLMISCFTIKNLSAAWSKEPKHRFYEGIIMIWGQIAINSAWWARTSISSTKSTTKLRTCLFISGYGMDLSKAAVDFSWRKKNMWFCVWKSRKIFSNCLGFGRRNEFQQDFAWSFHFQHWISVKFNCYFFTYMRNKYFSLSASALLKSFGFKQKWSPK